jgi:cytochrome b561
MRYTGVARLLHWLTVLAVLAIAAVGLWMTFAEPAEEAFKLRLYNIHESLGITLLLVTLLRLFWRWRHPPPPLPADLPVPMRLAAHATHLALYALLLAMPVVGLMATNAWGFPLTAFGILPIPSPIGPDEALAPRLSWLHAMLALALGGVAAMHIGAALFHHVIRRDDILRRML